MKKKSLSTLGFIMEKLNIQTVSMSRYLHVDASLISKWKTGDRHFSSKSIYFEDVIQYLMDYCKGTHLALLKNILLDLYPHESIEDDEKVDLLLRQTLATSSTPSPVIEDSSLFSDHANVLSGLIFNDNNGHREAINKLLNYAESMPTPGELIFIDSAEYEWLIEDENYAAEFTKRIVQLLHKGFHAKFVIHYSSYKERFIKLFNFCSSLIYHRNIEWYYYEYYDEGFFNFSFFILNHAIAILGLSSSDSTSTTLAFTNSDMVIRLEALANQVIKRCNHLFTNFDSLQFVDVVNEVYHSRRRGTFYSFLPVPAFISVESELLIEILKANHIDDASIETYLDLNHKLDSMTANYFSEGNHRKDDFIYVFQYEEMLHRVKNCPFSSRSLSLLENKAMKISPAHYATELRNLAERLKKYDNLHIVLISKKDGISLPAINCWCKKNTWMVQMDKEGFRLTDEISVVNAAAITLDQCIRKVPPERKDKASVYQHLLELADELTS